MADCEFSLALKFNRLLRWLWIPFSLSHSQTKIYVALFLQSYSSLCNIYLFFLSYDAALQPGAEIAGSFR